MLLLLLAVRCLRVGLEDEPELPHEAGMAILRDAETLQVPRVDTLVGQRRPLHLQQLSAKVRPVEQTGHVDSLGRGTLDVLDLLCFGTMLHHLCQLRRWLRRRGNGLLGRNLSWAINTLVAVGVAFASRVAVRV